MSASRSLQRMDAARDADGERMDGYLYRRGYFK